MQRVKTYEDGLRDAAKILTNAAEDLEQGFARRRHQIEADIRNRQLGVGAARQALRTDESQARTLHGLAWHVRALSPSENPSAGPQDGSAGDANPAQVAQQP